MMYCTKCGSDLKGSKSQCPVCRYPVDKMKNDLAKPREHRRPSEGSRPWAPPLPDQRDPSRRTSQRRTISSDEKVARILEGPAEVEEGPEEEEYYHPEPQARKSYVSLGDDLTTPAVEEEEEEEHDPTVVQGGCSVCGSRPDKRCFFCLVPICSRHTVDLKIFVRSMPFGGTVQACPKCANQRHGQNPTRSEAQEAGMFFSIKPYHEWRKV